MSLFTVEGNTKLSGSIKVSGNKNEALPVIAASLLCSKKITLENVPNIGDVRAMLDIAQELGADISAFRAGKVSITSKKIHSTSLPLELSAKIRGSILFASTLLAREGIVALPQPGGDTIGRRRLDTHFLVFKTLGAKVSVKHEITQNGEKLLTYILKAPKGLKGGNIYLDEASVTATENAVIAASGAYGKTVITNAASEPHVQGLCIFLQKAGVKIEGIGSNVLTIYGNGVKNLSPLTHRIGCDYIEAGSFIGMAAATGSEITITNVDTDVMRMILFQFARLGITVKQNSKERTLLIPKKQSLKIKKDLGGAIPKLEDSPWPGFPADLTSIMLVTATQCKGTCLIHEKLFESRLFFTDKLISMGAEIVLCDPHRAVVVGASRLHGDFISSPDIRAGMALLIAAMVADGQSTIYNIDQIDRGYEKIDERLRAIGAKITRQKERRQKK